jgi:maltooligosyltrehalose trehalohydrolase
VADDGAWLVLHRGAIDVVLTLADGSTAVPLPTADAGSPQVLLAWGDTDLSPDGTTLTLQGPGVAVVRSA